MTPLRMVKDKETALSFIQERGMTLSQLLESKETKSNKALAVALKTAPNVVQRPPERLDVTYGVDGRNRRYVLQNRLACK